MRLQRLRRKKVDLFTVAMMTLLALLLPSLAYPQSGGGFEITEAVAAAGGETSSGGIFEVTSTSGQAVAPGLTGWNEFSITSGFWTYTALAPTAASISISGRVLNPSGSGLLNAFVYLQMRDGTIYASRTANFGYYRFDGIEAGQTVYLWVVSKQYVYTPRTITAADEVTDLDFIPDH